MKPSDRIIFALDVSDAAEARRYTDLLRGHVGVFKVGLELFIAGGPQVVSNIVAQGGAVMLDLKLHDIPETVERAVLRAGDLGVKFLTLHVQQPETMRRAVKAAEKSGLKLLGVTVLTSMTVQDCFDLGMRVGSWPDTAVSDRVQMMAEMAWREGVRGFVASPKEVLQLRQELAQSITLVIPGIRPAGAATGDQKRTGTPAETIRDGADYLVVGRPIRDAADPVAAANAIAAEIASIQP